MIAPQRTIYRFILCCMRRKYCSGDPIDLVALTQVTDLQAAAVGRFGFCAASCTAL